LLRFGAGKRERIAPLQATPVRRGHAPGAYTQPIEPRWGMAPAGISLADRELMTTSLRSSSRWLLVLLVCNTACDTAGSDDCDANCYFDYKHCKSEAEDDAQRARCEAELDQCRGICAAQPMDTGERR